jgi:hypothetical protein
MVDTPGKWSGGGQLRPYQQKVLDELAQRAQHETVIYPYRYGTGVIVPPRPTRQGKSATWSAELLSLATREILMNTPVRTIEGLWEARKPPIYYHVQHALSLWHGGSK